MASFFFDKDADMRIGRWLKRRGHSLTSAAEQHWDAFEDRELLMLAGPQGLILVTHNEGDFIALLRTGTVGQHGGILVLPQVHPEEVETVVSAVDWLVNSERTGFPRLANELYRFRVTAGWERWDDEHGWVQVVDW